MIKRKYESKILESVKKHKVIISIITLILVLVITGTTLAIYLISGEGNDKNYTLANINVEYIDGDTIKAENAIPLADYEIEEYAAKKEFNFKNTGSETLYAEILLTEIEMDESLKSNDFIWELYEENNDEYIEIANGNFEKINDRSTLSLKKGIRVDIKAESKKYKTLVYIKDNGQNQNTMENKNMKAKVKIVATDKSTLYEDNSGANSPKLAEGMIPVKYDEKKDAWVKADLYDKWYDYEDGMWANAVTVGTNASNCSEDCMDDIDKNSREYYLNVDAGTPISMDDINTMWVWIPRYKYKIPTSVGISTPTPPEIEVVFEKGLQATGVDEATYRAGINSNGTNKNYYTHPAFRDGNTVYNEEQYDIGGWDEELTGFWFAKFETGGTHTEPLIKPDLISLKGNPSFTTSIKITNGTLSDGIVNFEINPDNIYGLNTKNNTTDSHTAKKIEWGAVAVLSQSRYGKMGNTNYEQNNKEIYINNSSSFYTGRSGGDPTMGSTSTGTYSYNDHKCEDNNTVICTGNKERNKGTGASTSGTIYGIYDMSGGSWEYVMGLLLHEKVNDYPRKYYDAYYNQNDLYNDSIMGDLIKETYGWYSDGILNSNTYYWLCISGDSSSGSKAGIFNTDGGNTSRYAFRMALVP